MMSHVEVIAEDGMYYFTDEECRRGCLRALQFLSYNKDAFNVCQYRKGSSTIFLEQMTEKIISGIRLFLQTSGGLLIGTSLAEILFQILNLLVIDYGPDSQVRLKADTREQWLQDMRELAALIKSHPHGPTNGLFYYLQLAEQSMAMLENTQQEGLEAAGNLLLGVIKSVGTLSLDKQLLEGLVGGVKYGAKQFHRHMHTNIHRAIYLIDSYRWKVITNRIRGTNTSRSDITIIADLALLEEQVSACNTTTLCFFLYSKL